MAMYALSTQKFISELRERNPDVKQAWFADDSTGGSSVKKTHKWWTDVKQIGPKYGIFPEVSKCLLILKMKHMKMKPKPSVWRRWCENYHNGGETPWCCTWKKRIHKEVRF